MVYSSATHEMELTVEEYLARILDAKLAAADEVEELRKIVGGVSLDQIREELLSRGLITGYQDEKIRLGRLDELRLGNYEILDLIGQGGMGIVYKAIHRHMDRIVALKVLKRELLDHPTARVRFYREARVVSRLSHRNIVAAFDAGEANGLHYLVMEFVDGCDLAQMVSSLGPFQIDEALELTIQAALGLRHAHEQDIIHRDIKPANLLLSKDGVVKVLDLGLARLGGQMGSQLVPGEENLSRSGSVLGTLTFLSPEQALNTKQTDARSDIYSLGCTLYYLLIGSPPYAGDTLGEIWLAHREKPIPTVSLAGESINRKLNDVLHKMMAKNADERHDSIADLLDDLQSVLNRVIGGTRTALARRIAERVDDVQVTSPQSSAATDYHSAPDSPGVSEPAAETEMPDQTYHSLNSPKVDPPPGPLTETISTEPTFILETPSSAQGDGESEADAKSLSKDSDSISLQPPAPEIPLDSLRETFLADGLEFVLIKPGSIPIGDSESVDDAIQVPHFYLGCTLVTQKQYAGLMLGANPSYFSARGPRKARVAKVNTDDYPVEHVSWFAAVNFCNKLSLHCGFDPYYRIQGKRIVRVGGDGFRLPASLEWEHACRAGSSSKFSCGDGYEALDAHAWTQRNSKGTTHPVASLNSNSNGLFDMHGNVWEWCDDSYIDEEAMNDAPGVERAEFRVIRGGGWMVEPDRCCSHFFEFFPAGHGSAYTGFRIARSIGRRDVLED